MRKEDLVAVQKIITRGADVNARLQSNGETPIIVAAALGNARVVKVGDKLPRLGFGTYSRLI